MAKKSSAVAELKLPDYKDQKPAIKERFKAIYKRPVLLKIEGLEKTFKRHKANNTVLSNISLDVHRRELVSVIGPSGCGKSTLLRIVAGLETPSAGSLSLAGTHIEGPGPDRGMVFQHYSLFPWQTVLQNVMFPLTLSGMDSSAAEVEAKTWVKLVGLDQFAGYFPSQLSGGMKQRVAIARALAAKPRVLLMDEPFGALDARTRCKMQNYLMDIWRNIDITVLFVTHDLDEAIYLADRIVVLQPHPKGIAEIIEVPLPQPRVPEHMFSPEFVAVKRRLEELIQHEDADVADHFSMLKLTQVGDEVL